MSGEKPSDRNPSTPLKPIPGSTWTDPETADLIHAYEEKWNSSKRGPLKAHQWEQIAAAIPSKSGTQCRHKVEKLRKRYRSERLRPVRSLWPFFDRMDRMERGPASSSSCSDLKNEFGDERCARKRPADDEEEEIDEGVGGLAAELRRFGEGYVRMERRRIEMMREKEREWMEMESRRLEMVMEAQRGLVETIAGAFWKRKTAAKKRDSEDL